MADSCPPAGFLDRAEVISELALRLGTAFVEECARGNLGRGFQVRNWNQYKGVFDQYCQVILDVRAEIESPLQGAEAVGDWLKKAAGVARQIRQWLDGREHDGDRNNALYMTGYDLNQVAESLQREIKAARKAHPAPDPFAFLDDPPARQSQGADLPSDSADQAAGILGSILETKRPQIEAGRETVFKRRLLEMGQGRGLSPVDADLGLTRLLNLQLVRVEVVIPPDPGRLAGVIVHQVVEEQVIPEPALTSWLKRLPAEAPDREQEEPERSEGEGNAEAGSTAKPAPRRKRKRQPVKGKALTPRQAEVVHIVGECKGDLAAAGRQLGIDRKTVEQHYRAAMQKLGKATVRHATQTIRSDRRGQADVTAEDDRRH